jgi:hypothetical protein
LKGAARYLSNAVNDTLSALSGGELGAPHLELTNPDQHAGANITNQLLAATPVLGELKATTATVEVVDAAVSLETTPSESPAVTRVLQTIDEGGFEVTANPKSATQTGNVTITNPSEPGVKLNLRSETHPIPGSGGQPVPHVNVERVEPGPKNRPEVVSNTHIDQ